MWSRTLLLFASDNGSPVGGWGAGGSNAPLRGGKGSLWEGGVRTPAFVNGGLLPDGMRGKQLNGFVHIADLFNTFCALAANAATTSSSRISSGSSGGGSIGSLCGGGWDAQTTEDSPSSLLLPTIDSLDVTPYLLGRVTRSPRRLIIHRFGRWLNNQEWVPSGSHTAPPPPSEHSALQCHSDRYALFVCATGGCRPNGWMQPGLTHSALHLPVGTQHTQCHSDRCCATVCCCCRFAAITYERWKLLIGVHPRLTQCPPPSVCALSTLQCHVLTAAMHCVCCRSAHAGGLVWPLRAICQRQWREGAHGGRNPHASNARRARGRQS